MKKEMVAVWAAEQMDARQKQVLFADSEYFDKDGHRISCFEADFNLQDKMIDFDSMIILDGKLGNTPVSMEQAERKMNGWSQLPRQSIRQAMETLGLEHLDYLLAVPSIKYNGRIKEFGSLKFIGNFEAA
ncbi:MAG: hypothetical protein WBO82_09925 [Neisseria sp.]